MACIECAETKPVPECVNSIILGTIAFNSEPIYVFVKNIITGYVHSEDSNSSAAGIVTLSTTLPDISFYNHNHLYEIWVTRQSQTINDRLPITIGALPYTCFLVPFIKVYSSNITTHTLSV